MKEIVGINHMGLRELLGTELPIIQAPMAGVQGSALAVAVSNAGGLGSLPCAMLSVEQLRDELITIKTQTSRPYNVNFFCHEVPEHSHKAEMIWRNALMPFYKAHGVDPNMIPVASRIPFNSDAVEILEEFKPPVVSFHFGLPSDELLARVKAFGAKVISSATTLEEALWLEECGADVIIAQGLEAGGHRGMFLSRDLNSQLGTFALLPQIVREVNVPVVAAGGIADANGVEAAMDLGASGVQIGTAYLLCCEALTSQVHRAALKSSRAKSTALTNIFTGRPARAIINFAMKELGPIHYGIPAFPLAASAISPLRTLLEAQGSGDFSPLWSGQNATGCKAIPAAELTRELAAGL
ncbi:MAG: nitronate monooxygenase [Porticoccus sp.]